jgi:tRNA (guanine26-N2/guanine27-N2)-dimethyltransferase
LPEARDDLLGDLLLDWPLSNTRDFLAPAASPFLNFAVRKKKKGLRGVSIASRKTPNNKKLKLATPGVLRYCSAAGHARKLVSRLHLQFANQSLLRRLSVRGMATASSPANVAENQSKHIEYDGIAYDIVREGLAEILNPVANKTNENGEKHNGKTQAQSVFYNPIQQFNRDLSVLAIRVFAEELVYLRQQQFEKKRKSDQRRGKRKQREGKNNELRESDDISKRQRVEDVQDSMEIDKDLNDDTTDRIKEQANLQPHESLQNSASDSVEAQDAIQSDIPAKSKPQTQNVGTRPPVRVLDALSASGLRALRYAKEIPQITSVIANDLSDSATKAIRLNIRHNGQEEKIVASTGDAMVQLHNLRGKLDVIDLDPYGTAVPFMDAAVQAISDGGLLCITCTDAGIFASTGYLEKTFSQYGGLPAKGAHSHEVGLRLILHAIATSAARYGLAIEPLLSLSIDFYARVFVKVRRSPSEVKFLASKTMLVHNCDSGCGAWTRQSTSRLKEGVNKKGQPVFSYSLPQAPTASPNCEHCGFKTHLAGPMWGGPIQNPFFIQRMLDLLPELSSGTYGTIPRMEGMLSIARDETILAEDPPESSQHEDENSPPSVGPIPRIPAHHTDNHPFFFVSSTLAGVLHCTAPSDAHIRGALLHLGYRAVRSHTKPGSIRTDASWSTIWEIMREWIRQKSPLKEGSLTAGMAGWTILKKSKERGRVEQAKAELEKAMSKEMELDDFKTQLESILWRLGTENSQEPEAKHSSIDSCKGLDVVFDEKLGKKGDEKRTVRYQLNPRPNWGPMTRARKN